MILERKKTSVNCKNITACSKSLEKAFAKNNIDAKSKKLIDDFLVDENVIIKPQLAKNIHKKIEDYEKVSNIEHLSKPPFSINFIKDQNLLDYDYDTDLSRVKLLKTFIDLSKKLKKHFQEVPDFNLNEEIKDVQNNSTVKMVNIFDDRFVDYVDHNRTHAQSLKRMISKKQKFPRDDLNRLKNAFPCIIAGIRDYAEYVPLEPEIFDLIVIDEASQVSIAQAFPAILRAKKIIVMGDKKQFSNVKATNSSKLINSNYQDGIRQAFRDTYGDDPQKLERSNIFNIRVSILEFFENITNYNCLLKKHFRGYPEIISFSSKNFYNNELQTIKVRAKPIDEVISFNDVNHDNLGEVLGNINKPESDFIVKEIEKLCELESPPSVGVITPMRDQQKFIFSELDKSEKRQAMKKLNIKVMTFDSCQGEEKDIIFYSFVDTAEKDISFRVLGSNFNLQTMDPEENLRMQRMNVGMSRAKEKIVFALSKPIDEYYGNTLKILSHYRNEVKIANKLPSPDETESPMEAKLLNWIRQTSFYSKHHENIEVQAQFEVGNYLKTLDPTYSHPNYRCDFLMTYTNKDEIKNLIIEYDGFLEHFVDREHVNEFNYSHYYSEQDIQREKILEGYGFPFLRINKFNLGKEPVDTLSKKLNGFFFAQENRGIIHDIRNTAAQLESGDLITCPVCKKNKSRRDFLDPSLHTGIGRHCMECKSKSPGGRSRKNREYSSGKICRKCNLTLVVGRNWSPSKAKKYDYICNRCNKLSRSGRKSKKTKNKLQGSYVTAGKSKNPPNCPKCGKKMIKRYAKKYKRYFWGCSAYSGGYGGCNGTRSL